MGYFKFDKLDKIVLSFTFIIVSIFSIFNCFCFANEDLNINTLDYALINYNGEVVNSTANRKVYYVELEKYQNYKLLINTKFGPSEFKPREFRIGFSETTPDYSTKLENFQVIEVETGEEITLDFTTKQGYLVLCLDTNYLYESFNPDFITIISSSKSLNNIIDILVDNVGINSILGIFGKSTPLLLVVVLFGFGFWFFAHWLKELSKGREF